MKCPTCGRYFDIASDLAKHMVYPGDKNKEHVEWIRSNFRGDFKPKSGWTGILKPLSEFLEKIELVKLRSTYMQESTGKIIYEGDDLFIIEKLFFNRTNTAQVLSEGGRGIEQQTSQENKTEVYGLIFKAKPRSAIYQHFKAGIDYILGKYIPGSKMVIITEHGDFAIHDLQFTPPILSGKRVFGNVEFRGTIPLEECIRCHKKWPIADLEKMRFEGFGSFKGLPPHDGMVCPKCKREMIE